jgi:hypothetical protein
MALTSAQGRRERRQILRLEIARTRDDVSLQASRAGQAIGAVLLLGSLVRMFGWLRSRHRAEA